MSKAVLISIRPKWCGLIAGGKKTIEVRKTRPKLEPPFKCYISCTRRKSGEDATVVPIIGGGGELFKIIEERFVIGEFICDSVKPFDVPFPAYRSETDFDTLRAARLTYEEAHAYLGHSGGYAWHIFDLAIYDEPKKLSDFKRHDPTYDFAFFGEMDRTYSVSRPPQSWCYVEALE